MKKSLGCLMTAVMGGSLWLGSLPGALALPIVESRTGDPVLRPPLGGNVGTEHESAPLKSQQIEALKEEINHLRGTVEQQQHQYELQIQALKKSQQAFYVDLDKRLTQLEHPTELLPKESAANPAQASDQKPTVPVKSANKGKTVVSTAATIPTSSLTTSATIVGDAVAEGQEPAETASTTTEKSCYEAASANLSAKRYTEAIEGFQACVTRYPQGAYTAQCYYWLGEGYMAEWGSHKDDKTLLDKASQSFLMVTTRFPTHQRATDALLKLGMVEQEKGNLEVSKRYFEQVRDRYPDSAAARMAETYLQEE